MTATPKPLTEAEIAEIKSTCKHGKPIHQDCYICMESEMIPTPKPLTEAEIAEIRARTDAATPGPWLDSPGADSSRPQRQHHHEIRQIDKYPSDKHHWPHRICQTIEGQSSQQADLDFAFIAASRTDVPRLLDAHASLVAQLDAIKHDNLDLLSKHDVQAFMMSQVALERDKAEAQLDAANEWLNARSAAIDADTPMTREKLDRLAKAEADLAAALRQGD